MTTASALADGRRFLYRHESFLFELDSVDGFA